jgi:tungstate transport system ATP-binding protein
MPSAVSVKDLKLTYGEATILDLPGLDFEAGRIHVLVGPNGAGKTMLLRVLSGLERPTAGSVSVLGADLLSLAGRDRLNLMRRMTFCFQKPYLFSATVQGNIEYGLYLRRLPASETSQRVDKVLSTLNLAHLRHRHARTLSAGETQRVSLARALVLQPELVLLDEPIANVDAQNIPAVEGAITGLHSRGTTVIAATHAIEQAYRLSASVTRLEHGRPAPPALENLLEGTITARDGLAILTLSSGLELVVTTDKRGPARASIPPSAIIISAGQVESSARNSLPGRVTALTEHNGGVSVTIDAGIPLVARITRESFNDLHITLGSQVYLTFKASAVTVF